MHTQAEYTLDASTRLAHEQHERDMAAMKEAEQAEITRIQAEREAREREKERVRKEKAGQRKAANRKKPSPAPANKKGSKLEVCYSGICICVCGYA